jgi:hypothetical protein
MEDIRMELAIGERIKRLRNIPVVRIRVGNGPLPPNKPPSCSAPISERADSRRYAVTEALEQRDFQLLGDP